MFWSKATVVEFGEVLGAGVEFEEVVALGAALALLDVSSFVEKK
jgi:hypothetical protein